MDLLGYGKYSSSAGEAYTDAVISNGGLGSVSPLRALAYQKIYSDYYRNSTYEQFDMSKFNIDFLYLIQTLEKYLLVKLTLMAGLIYSTEMLILMYLQTFALLHFLVLRTLTLNSFG